MDVKIYIMTNCDNKGNAMYGKIRPKHLLKSAKSDFLIFHEMNSS